MKNKIILSIVASTLMIGSLNAFDLEYRLDKIENKMAKMAKMSKEYNNLKNNYMEDIEETEETISRLETASAINSKVQLGVDFSTIYNYYDITRADGNNYVNNNFLRSKVGINMYSPITKNMTFDGTLSMYKNWADDSMNSLSYYDSKIGMRPTNSAVYLTRAYIDWKMPMVLDGVPMTLTVGRQPSTSGSTYEFINDTPRRGTFSALAFDGNADGIVLTVGINKYTGLEKNNIRLAYGKSFQFDEGNVFDNVDIPYESNIKDSQVLGVFTEAEIPGFKNSMMQLSYVKAFDAAADSSSGGLAQMMGLPASTPNTTVGDIELISGMLVMEDFMETGWDIFGHYSFSKSTPSDTPFAGMLGLLSNGNDMTVKEGNAFWVGGKYELSNGYKFGLEYNQGSKYWFSFTPGSENVYNKLATRGSASEAYVILPINRVAHVKLGALYIDYKYTGSGSHLGEPVLIENLPASMKSGIVDTMTNYYVSFEVKF